MNNEFEQIVPWNGAQDTGRDVRLKWQRNFERIKSNFEEISELLKGTSLEELQKIFLRKDQDDQTEHLIKFLSGLHCGEFNQGSTGVGIYQDDAGNWHIETDYLDVRIKFTAREVEIQRFYHIAGAQIKSSANMKCVRVEELEDVYRCYMNTTDDDGNEITNDFKVQDQAYVQTFNLVKQADGTVGNHFLWRLVVAVGDDYMDLSKSVCAEGSDAPKAGDDIVQLGYQGTDDPNRQNAVIDAGAGNGSPYYRQFVGIDSFTLPAPETQLKPGDNELSGRFHIEQGSTGWKNMDGLPEEIQEAMDAAQAAQEGVDGIGVGSVNLLRNSGFTGNYETESLTSGTGLQPGTEMYSKALLHWSGIATVQEDTDAVSGRSATVGSLSQALVALIPNEHYVISYKAKGTSLAVACGDFSVAQPLTTDYRRYVHKFTFTGTGTFLLSGTATVCDLQLERGTIATDWKPSPLDNDKTAARFQSIQYIADAIKNGSVDILGGLILASMLQLGNYKDGEMQKVTAGVSGIYNDDDDVYTWGGGTLEQAIRAVMMFKDDPTYQPDEAELRQIAKAVITHGGWAILNDVILRGYVYALGGIFQGRVSIAGGKILLDEDGSGKLANGNVRWDADGNIYITGEYESNAYGRKITISPGNYVGWPSIKMTDEDGNTLLSIDAIQSGDYVEPKITMQDPNDSFRNAEYRMSSMVINEKIGDNNFQTFIGAGHIYIAKNSVIDWEINRT